MADAYIQSLTDLWNDAGTTYHAIKMNVTNSASAVGSRLLALQVGGSDKFSVDKNGNVVAAGAVLPSANDGAALGASGTAWSDLFLASGSVINWNAGDVTATHSANALAFAGASSGYSFDASLLLASGSALNFNGGDVTVTHSANALAFAGATTNGYSFADGPIKPATNDGAALGVSGAAWSDLFLASGAVIDFAAGNAVLTHSSGILTLGVGDLRISTAGTTTASAVTVGGTQTLINKSLSDSTTFFVDEADATKKAQFQLSGIATGTTRTYTMPNASGTIVLQETVPADAFSGLIGAPANKTYTLVLKCPFAGTINETVTICASGTCTATFKINGTPLGGTANSVSSSKQTQAQASANTFAIGDDIAVTISANSSCVDMAFTIKVTKSF